MTQQQLRILRSHLSSVVDSSRWLPDAGTLADSEHAPTYQDYKQEVFNLLVELDEMLPQGDF